MSKPQLPEPEAARLDALYQYEILDTPREAVYDGIVYLAAQLSNTPIALINFIDRNRQWFKASIGWTPELPGDIGFCANVILQRELSIIPDASCDSRFANNPLVIKEPHIRFYAGVPLITAEGYAIGTLCVMDQRSRTQRSAGGSSGGYVKEQAQDPNLAETLSTLGRQVVSHLEARRQLIYSARVIAQSQRTEAALQQSERLRVEEELRSSEERVRQLAENLHQIFWMSSVDMKQILYISPAYEEIVQRTCASLYQQAESWIEAIHPLDLEYVSSAIEKQMRANSSYDVEYRIIRLDGTIRWLWARTFPVRNSEGAIYRLAGIAEDITQRKQTEHQIQASLKEKEVLLQEIHHRVKNNLQVISSLLNLQSGYIKDEQALKSFKESQNRIKSIALIHENLYQTNNISQINFAEYVQQLVVNLFYAYGVNSSVISLKVNVEDVLLSVDKAIPCGLIINELVSNCIKHAFPPGKSGEVCILLIRTNQNNKVILTVRDNGVGFPKNIDFRNPESLGLQLVNTLAAQIKGKIELNCNEITEFKLKFRLTESQ